MLEVRVNSFTSNEVWKYSLNLVTPSCPSTHSFIIQKSNKRSCTSLWYHNDEFNYSLNLVVVVSKYSFILRFPLLKIITDTYGRTIRSNSMPTPCWKINCTTTVIQVDYMNGSLRRSGGGSGGDSVR